MHKLYNHFYLAICLTLCACSATKRTTADFNKFPVATTTTEIKLFDTGLPMPQLMTIYKDSLLLVVNNMNRDPHHVRVYDITGKKAVNNLLPASRQKGGTLSFMSFGISDSLLWIFDVAKNGFITGNIDTLLTSDGRLALYSEYRLKPQIFYYDALLLNRNEALLSGNYDTDEKLIYRNFSDSSLNKTLLSYRQDPAIGSSRINKTSYESFMLLRPDKQKVLLAGRYTDQFELLDLTNGSYKKVKGPAGFAPQLSPFEDNTGKPVAAPDNETLYGFLKGHVTGQFFYLLFSGSPVKSDRRFYGNKILVFDWDGNPVKQINLKNDIVDFTVSSDNKILYTLNPRTKAVNFAQLK